MEEVAAVITVVDGWHGANRGMRILAIKSRIIVVIFFLGASIYDVRTEGGRGVSPKEDVVREVA